jgi:hypothetical protein
MSMVWIAGQQLSGNASSIAFSSIPNTFTHLQIKVFGRTDRGTYNVGTMNVQVNGDTGANYSQHFLRSAPASPSTGVEAFGYASQTSVNIGQCAGSTATSGIFGNIIIDILDYANTSKAKTLRGIGGVDTNGAASGVAGFVQFSSGAWFSTSAINSVTLLPGDGASNFVSGTRADLYGITTSQATGA